MIGLAEIEAARERIAGHVLRTELRHSPGLSTEYGAPVYLKLEHHQITGSFKLRGATNAILCLGDEARAKGVATASTGNHGRAVAHAARAVGVRAVICMSSLVPQNKLAAVEALGAEIRIVGRSQDEAQREVDRLAEEEGVTPISPFDDAPVIAGQGTLGLEIIETLPEIATVVVPLSGGGLIAGTAAAIKARAPKAHVVGVSMERGPAMYESLKAGEPVAVEEQPSLADSLGGGIGLENRHTFEMCRTLVDETVLLTEAEIAEGVRYAYWKEQEIVEGGGGVAIAALRAGKLTAPGPAALVLSGRNIDMETHFRLVSGEMTNL